MSTLGKWLLLASLYFSQGLPYGFFTQALPALMREKDASLPLIGLTSFLVLPWALKFLWAPLVDRYGSHRLGRRRSWILTLQLLGMVVFLGLGARGESEGYALLMIGFFFAKPDFRNPGCRL